MRSPDYWHPFIYDAGMRLLYGRDARSRLTALARWIPDGSSVVELCVGSAQLYRRELRFKRIEYRGFDINEGFVRHATRKGVPCRILDVARDEIPSADIIVMQAALYHFLPDAGSIIRRMVEAARRYVLVSEAVRNLADGNSRFLRHLARWSNDTGTGRAEHRFTIETLEQCLKESANVQVMLPLPGGREWLSVLTRPGATPDSDLRQLIDDEAHRLDDQPLFSRGS